MKYVLVICFILSLVGCGKSGTLNGSAAPTNPSNPVAGPTPSPLIGVWQNQNDVNDIFSFAATTGAQASCTWNFNWTQTGVGTIGLTMLASGINAVPCDPAPGMHNQNRTCSVSFVGDNNHILMTCLYEAQQTYIRQ